MHQGSSTANPPSNRAPSVTLEAVGGVVSDPQKEMEHNTSRPMTDEEEGRCCRGCFGWLFRLFRRRRGRRSRRSLRDIHNEPGFEVMSQEPEDVNVAQVQVEEEQVLLEDESVMEKGMKPDAVLTWAEEVEEAEKKGLDVFAPYSEALLEVLRHFPPTTFPEQGEARSTVATMTSAARRRARRKTLRAAHKLKTETRPTDAAVTTETGEEQIDTTEIAASEESEADVVTVTTGKMTACQRRRARRKAVAAVRNQKGEAHPS